MFTRYREWLVQNPAYAKEFERRVIGTLLEAKPGRPFTPGYELLTNDDLWTVLKEWQRMQDGGLAGIRKPLLPRMISAHAWMLPDAVGDLLKKYDVEWVKKEAHVRTPKGLTVDYVLAPMSRMTQMFESFRKMNRSIDSRINDASVWWSEERGKVEKAVRDAIGARNASLYFEVSMLRRLIRYWKKAISVGEKSHKEIQEMDEGYRKIYLQQQEMKANALERFNKDLSIKRRQLREAGHTRDTLYTIRTAVGDAVVKQTYKGAAFTRHVDNLVTTAIKRHFPNTPNTCLLYTSPSPRDS